MIGMKSFIESLSLGSGAVLVAAFCALLAWPLSYLRLAFVRWPAALALPILVSYCLYWLPVWLGASPSEYFSWAFLFIGAWFLAGVITSAVVIVVVGRYHAKRK